jgi:aldehyde:ferredoxin oxidoreductase
MVHFSDYIYNVPYGGFGNYAKYYLPGREKGKWDYIRVNGRYLDKAKFEEFKTKFYNLEGWDAHTGWPKRGTLESLGLKSVADELEKNKNLVLCPINKLNK